MRLSLTLLLLMPSRRCLEPSGKLAVAPRKPKHPAYTESLPHVVHREEVHVD